MIPDPVIEQIRDRADIVEIVGEHVQLKRAGKDFKALCPFHREKTPSFYVVPGKAFYKCFGCGESGDVFAFLMNHLGLGFQEAVERVAARVGIEIPSSTVRPEEDENRPLYEAVAFAADYYQRRLWDERDGERARRYLDQRGIGREPAERFLLGYAPDDWRALREAAHGHGMEDDLLEAAGLIKTSERSEEPYDRFRDRLIFPITDIGGRVIAFGGRILGAGGTGAPKYLNSPETTLYHKGRTLYGLKWSKSAMRREGAALVVEGYMDYVSLAARGVEHVVAALGTAMTAEQAGLLARYAKQALLLYDSDTAGLRATFRSGDELLRAGVHPLVVTFPPGEDPDSVARAGGAEALQPYLDDAVDLLDRKIQILDERAYFADVDGIRKALDGLLPTLRAAADPALRDIYVDRVARRTGVRRETIERELQARTRTTPRPRQPDAAPAARIEPAERKLLLLLVHDTDRVAEARRTLEPGDFRDPTHRALYEGLISLDDEDEIDLAAFEAGPEAVRLLEQLRGSREELTDTDRIFWDTVDRMRYRSMYEKLASLRQRIALGGEEDADLLAEIAALKRKLPASWSGWGRR